MAIARVGIGAAAGTETTGAALNLVCPAVVAANDILIAHVMHTGNSTNPTTPSGWSLLYPDPADITVGAPVGTGTPTARHWAFGKLAIGDEDGDTISFGTGGGTNGRYGRIYSYSGYVSGTLADVVPFASFSDQATETDPAGPSVTTTVAGALAIALMCQDDNNSHSGLGAQTGGTWADYQEATNSALGPQGLALAYNSCTPDADPGTVSGGSLAGTNDESGTIGFEIRPNAPVVSDDLTADDLTSGVPTLGTPAIGQEHVLAATNLAAGAPTLGTPVLAEAVGTDALTADDVSSGTPTLGAPSISQIHVLTASSITTSVPTIGTPSIGQAHVLSAVAIAAGAPTLGNPAFAQIHVLTADVLTTSSPVLGTPELDKDEGGLSYIILKKNRSGHQNKRIKLVLTP